MGLGSDRVDEGDTMTMRTIPKELGVALSGDAYRKILLLRNNVRQEQVRLFYWRPSEGLRRFSAIIDPEIPPPTQDELIEKGNVAFTDTYLMRVLASVQKGCGIGVVHNHFSSGWQSLSKDDEMTEGHYLAPVVNAALGLPLLGMTLAQDGTLSARFWKTENASVSKKEADSVRVVGKRFFVFHHPDKAPIMGKKRQRRIATTSVWESKKQGLLESFRVGIVGLGSVGSMVSESLARMGMRDFVLIDHDRLEDRNLDRTLGSDHWDVQFHRHKTDIAVRNIRRAVTGDKQTILYHKMKVQESSALQSLLDCDFVFSCVDRHLPRYILDHLAFSHLIPVINGGIAIDLPRIGKPSLDISWQAHLVSPDRPCMGCLNAYSFLGMQLTKVALLVA